MKLDNSEINLDFHKLWESAYDTEGVTCFDVNLFPSYVLVNFLLISKSLSNKGIGNRVMEMVCNFADKHQKDILVTPDEGYGTPMILLIHFYGNFGFVQHDISEGILIRKPKRIL